MTQAADIAKLATRCTEVLGDPGQWRTPTGYPDSLALCVLDSIWSIGVRYRGVANVLDKYRQLRRTDGAEPSRDAASQLVAAIASAGGPEAFTVALGNRQRTSTRGGVLKSEAVLAAAKSLVEAGLDTTNDVRTADADRLNMAESRWRAVTGQRSGISWRYLLLLAGLQQVKPDRMIVRFTVETLGRVVGNVEAAALVTAVSSELGTDVRTTDHRIWLFQSGRG